MAPVMQLAKTLEVEPQPCMQQGFNVRTWAGAADVAGWLELRSRAFARQQIGIREWTERDFEAEILSKPWWRPEHTWLVETVQPPLRLVGSVTLARRGTPERERPVAHWLMVDPSYRRRGVGSLLMATLEAACWHTGERQILLETHAGWREAAAFYAALGYVPVRSHH